MKKREIKAATKPYSVPLNDFRNVECLQCSICMDLIVACKTAVCGHSFCEECINESLLRRRECPNCRQDIRKQLLQNNSVID